LIRRIKLEARHLSGELEKGQGRDETLPIYEHLMTMVRDAREKAQKTFMPQPLLDKAAAAGDVLRRLAPYYDAQVLAEG
jgi:hypothetical protein